MVKISDFTEERYVERFAIEPPIEVGEHTVETLGRLAAIGATGPNADPAVIDKLTDEVEHTSALLYESGGVSALATYLTNVTTRRRKHTFFPSKY